jgi:nucleoside 2-deoxyribosyltransferase
MKIYIATKLENTEQYAQVREVVLGQGHTITYDWTVHGSVKHTSLGELERVGMAEEAGVMDADVVIGLLPGGRGTHWELGQASGLQKPIVLLGTERHFGLGSETTSFYHVHGVLHVGDLKQLATVLQVLGRLYSNTVQKVGRML